MQNKLNKNTNDIKIDKKKHFDNKKKKKNRNNQNS